ncbi:MAG: glycine/betaine ABC transporter substrate-binding protein [Colwelliaceae bacterium]|nr:glycine/betaine ABC transporter substrate-binding protein [Colwelliaceae bacterium]
MKAVSSLLFTLLAFFHCISFAQNQVSIPLNEWSSQRVLSKALGKVISDAGTPVEYVEINVEDQWGALKRGAIHFQIEVWEPSMKEPFNALVAQNDIVEMGTHEATVIEDWWYPKYVEKYCPLLPDWKALNECIAIFKESPSDTKGVYHGGPWDYGDADIIRALNINFEINRFPNSVELWKQLNIALEQEQPIVLLNWSPNWTDKYAKGSFIKFPEYHEQCETDPDWGLNKKYVKDCGNRKHGWLKKAASHTLKHTNHCVFEFIEQANFTKDMIVDASALVVVNKLTEDAAAQHWIDTYSAELKQWRSNTCL